MTNPALKPFPQPHLPFLNGLPNPIAPAWKEYIESVQRLLKAVEATDWSVPQATDAVLGTVRHATEAQVRAALAGNTVLLASHLAPTRVALTDASTVAVDWAASAAEFSLTVTANRQIGNPTNGIPGQYRTIIVQGNNATDRTITFGDQFLNEAPEIDDCDSDRWYAIDIHCIAADHFAAFARIVKGSA